jgi:hypothetical protein
MQREIRRWKTAALLAGALLLGSCAEPGDEGTNRDGATDDTSHADADADTDSGAERETEAEAEAGDDAEGGAEAGDDAEGGAEAGDDADAEAGDDAEGDGDDDTDGSTDDCPEELKYVYVVDVDNTFYRFDPRAAAADAFSRVGVLSCASGGQPFAMSISREGHALVLFSAGMDACVALNKADIDTAECFERTAFACGSGGIELFSLGFVSESLGSADERLFIGDMATPSLATLDTRSWVVTPVGTMPAAGPDFTGNGRGELWAFYPRALPPRISRLDKTSGAELVGWPLPDLPPTSSDSVIYAFTTWGGSFYIFLKVTPPDTSTTVYRVQDGVLSVHIPDTGLQIIGAGVSTCAPVVF